MNKTSIEWTDYTWNPVTGCKGANGDGLCSYCYIKRLRNYNINPEFHPERLEQPLKVKKSQKIFVCSTADLFGDWIPEDWIKKVIDITKEASQHTFQFLTKNPKRFRGFVFPLNTWLGTTVEKDEYAYRVLDLKLFAKNKWFVSFEPLMGDMKWVNISRINWIIIGAMTGKDAEKFAPKEEWIDKILVRAKNLNIPVFMKDNLKPNWSKKLIQEFPE